MQSPKIKDQISAKNQSNKTQTYFDLEERIANFGEGVVTLCRALPQNAVTKPLISQVVRSATSIGANYAEANNAISRKDFRNKVYISKKEAQETRHWLRMLVAAVPDKKQEIQTLGQENHEILLILQSIVNKIDKRNSEN